MVNYEDVDEVLCRMGELLRQNVLSEAECYELSLLSNKAQFFAVVKYQNLIYEVSQSTVSDTCSYSSYVSNTCPPIL